MELFRKKEKEHWEPLNPVEAMGDKREWGEPRTRRQVLFDKVKAKAEQIGSKKLPIYLASGKVASAMDSYSERHNVHKKINKTIRPRGWKKSKGRFKDWSGEGTKKWLFGE